MVASSFSHIEGGGEGIAKTFFKKRGGKFYPVLRRAGAKSFDPAIFPIL